jgi:hypothetical protein
MLLVVKEVRGWQSIRFVMLVIFGLQCSPLKQLRSYFLDGNPEP